MIVGYCRTSTSDQTAGLAAQERDLKAAGAEQTSSDGKRTALATCLSFLRPGDVLAVSKPDRLARSTAELLAIEADHRPPGARCSIGACPRSASRRSKPSRSSS